MARTRARRQKAAFSLLEVMVAVAILGLALSVILSAQGGLAASNRRAENMGNAANLGRCKMTEIEEKMLKLGYPELDAVDQDQPCCNDDSGKFRCDTKVEKIILPLPPQNGVGDGGAALALGSATAAPGVTAGAPGGLVNNPLGGAGLNLSFDGGIGAGGLQGLGAQLGQATGGQGAAGLINMVLGFLYPQLKLMFEAAIRKVTVTVRWTEGIVPRDFELVQYITNPARAGFVAGVPTLGDGGVSPVSTSSAGGGATKQSAPSNPFVKGP